MTLQKSYIAYLYALAAAIIVFNVYLLIAMRDIWTDSLFNASDRFSFGAQVVFWMILGAFLLFALRKRAHMVLLLTLVGLVYLVISAVVTVLPLAEFYLVNTSGFLGVKILASVAAPNIAQITLFVIAAIMARKLQKSGALT
jgi:membrane-bound ClpP family serine protease